MDFRSRMGAWILGGLFAILTIELVLLSPKLLDKFEEEEVSLDESREHDDRLAQVMVGINVVETRDERKDWELWADQAISRYGNGDLDLENVKIRFYGTGDIEFLVTGDRGIVEAETKNMQVLGAVLVQSSNGYTFKTDNLNYLSDVRELFGEAPVTVVGPRLREGQRLYINGIGMRLELSTERMKILSQVSARRAIPNKPSENMKIRSGSAILSSRDQSISFHDEVFIGVEAVSVTGPMARFVYDPSGRRLKAIELEGGVRVSDWSKWATSESVKIDLLRNSYTFRGRPRVVQDADELFGDEIVFLDGGKRVKVKNARVRVSKERLEEED